MPSSAIAHIAVFSVGAALGAGIAAGVASRKHAKNISVAPPSESSSQIAGSAPLQLQGPLIQASNTRAHGVLQLAPTVPSDVLRYGNPGPISDLIVRKAYVAGYDRRLRHPAWTAEHLTLSSLSKSASKGDRSKSEFKEDQSLPVSFRARLQDYFRSGYDRGHMVPAADAKEAMDETFLLSNIAPQVGRGFNQHYWAYTEDWCRRLTNTFQDVFVFTVPLYLPKQDQDGKYRVTYEVIGSPPNVSVPTHFAKVVLGSRPSSPSTPQLTELSLGAFVLPNSEIPDDTPLTKFVVPVETVERAAGLVLFSDDIKQSSKHICQTAQCEVIVRRFDDAQRQTRRALPAPK
ncbi:DNA/RNA non-specific nuclease [Rhizoctonia solani]|uniref:Endonuclease n=1 Tax=Rhizoctonia solani TaxID=456999 RepID=A0A8H8NTF5_9AGAM|nr:DNA/RNA non-specific nuclease [Rhizoctonia solani]QRW18300.1 DNA/RNA non-specific nuclease [Rhizoctonia solani]